MSNVFFTADLHLKHKNIVGFSHQYKGLSPYATSDEHDQHVIEQINSRVTKRDHLWILGDVYFGESGDQLNSLMHEIKGTKHLILGNHDTLPVDWYNTCQFASVHAMYAGYDSICTHIPIHPDELRRWKFNIHGHLHHTSTQQANYYIGTDECGYDEVKIEAKSDPRYLCVSLEQNNCLPFSLDEIRDIRKHRGI